MVEKKAKTKSATEFDTKYACSIKALDVKKNNVVKFTR